MRLVFQRLLLLFMLAYVVLVGATDSQAQDKGKVYLVRDGKPEGLIFIPSTVGHPTVLAAEELQRGIQKMTGAKLPIKYAGEPEKRYRKAAIVLKPEKLGPYIEPDRKGDEFTIVERKRKVTIEGRSEVAVLFGVYQYLQDLGARWYMPGDLGEVMPEFKNLAVGSKRKTYKPSFPVRELDLSGTPSWHFDGRHLYESHEAYALWLLRNRLQFARTSMHTRNLHAYDFNWRRDETGHNLRKSTLRDVSVEDEPERFPLVTRNGKKVRFDRGQICYTHPANAQAAVDAAVEYFESNPHKLSFSLSLEDTGGHCECERCIEANRGVSPAIDPNRVVWKFMNEVARKLGEKMPGKRIAFYSTYGQMTAPPEDINAEPNILSITCHVLSQAAELDDPDDPYNQQFLDYVKQVRAVGGQEMGAYDYSMYQGTPQPLMVLRSPKVYHDMEFIRYHMETMGRDEQRWLVQWVLAQLLWNVDQDPLKLLQEACDAMYGQAGDDVMAVMELIDERAQAQGKIVLGTEVTAHRMLDPETVEAGRKILASAAQKVQGENRRRLQRFIETFEIWVHKAQVIRAMYHYQQERTQEAKRNLDHAFDKFDAYWETHDLDTIVSPVIRRSLYKWVAQMEKLPSVIGLTEPTDLADVDHQTLLEAASHLAEPLPEDAWILPENSQFQIDPDDEGQSLGWADSSFDDHDWPIISTWAIYDHQGYPRYNGAFWHRLRFQAPELPQGNKVWLRIGSLDDGGDIYLNSQKVYTRKHLNPNDWQTAFDVDITDAIHRNGENVLVIHGENTYGAGGLWRPSAIYVTD